ncbi:hypothetical protein B566_EDAN013152 [Ephemera danica]|nr:hypothetical protein B566_EDAN013152 [Ephemera danica]
MILRIQSCDGTKRIQASPSDTTKDLFEKAHDAFGYSSYNFALYYGTDRKSAREIPSSRSRSVASLGLNHGDLLYLQMLNGTPVDHAEAGPSTRLNVMANTKSNIEEHPIDVQLWGEDGKIERGRDAKLCRHGANGRCIHCSPLEPYNETYLKEHNIKHLSFHAYLRKLTAGVDRGKFVCLEDLNCRVRPGCKDHPPWPQGICSKCQPSAITLNRQSYRHIDNVMFENASLVERFLNYWRTTGHQRVGMLYGRYEAHADVPLGIRAIVAAIYEPPQNLAVFLILLKTEESSRDLVRLLPDERRGLVDELAEQLGLCCVGWIFTDLLAEDIKKGTVKHCRNIESHFLSAQECITAGYFQNQHPNPCRFSPSGYFGSKFVTVCVTGDASNQVHMEGYSVSNQCMALVRDNCLVPTKDAPELGYIRESSGKQYVPDVFYKETNCNYLDYNDNSRIVAVLHNQSKLIVHFSDMIDDMSLQKIYFYCMPSHFLNPVIKAQQQLLYSKGTCAQQYNYDIQNTIKQFAIVNKILSYCILHVFCNILKQVLLPNYNSKTHNHNLQPS